MERDTSLDAFRGLTVIMMIIVNIQGNGDLAYSAFEHAEWDGLTFADVIFPWFLFIVGLSVPLALDRKHSNSPWPQIIKRAFMLFFWGVFLSWLIRPVEFEKIRWLGVLQRIGIVYFFCAAVTLNSKGWKMPASLAATGLVVHSLLLLGITAPGEVVPSLDVGKGLNAWLDQQFLPGRLLRKTYDPEGILSTLPAISSGLIGVAVARWKQILRTPIAPSLLAAGIILALAGAALTSVLPVNKQLWTSSFTLLTAGLGLICWAALLRLWPLISDSRIARFMVLLGQTALTLYIIHMLLLCIIVRKMGDGTRLWDVLYDMLVATGLSPAFASLLFALIAGAICTAPLAWLKRRGLLVKA
jgi:predicted acyltransferase